MQLWWKLSNRRDGASLELNTLLKACVPITVSNAAAFLTCNVELRDEFIFDVQ